MHPRPCILLAAACAALLPALASAQGIVSDTRPPLAAAQESAPVAEDVGPLVGHVDAHTAHLLIRRGSAERTFRLYLSSKGAPKVDPVDAVAEAGGDHVARFKVEGLQPDTRYRYRIVTVEGRREKALISGKDYTFRTASSDRRKGEVKLCFTSCVDIEENPMWEGIAEEVPDMLVLMGDTPYIDSSDLEIARQRHREFLAMPGLSDLIRSIPSIGTWDDHDFGRNNGNGRNMREGKKATRQAFVEYRAHARHGTGSEGVFHSIDLGMIELFLLDPRYFSQTGPSPVLASQPTCFGDAQWTWITESLNASQAPFKVLALGAIWEDKKNAETDDMFTYWYERDALLDLIERERIGGVVLLGGDIHVSRHLIHRQRVAYDLHDFVVSPGHERTITGLDVYHPSLAWSLVEGQQFLTMTAAEGKSGPTLSVRFQQADGVVNRTVELSLEDLTPRHAEGIELGRRAHWSFEKDFEAGGSVGHMLATEPSHGGMLKRDKDRGRVVQFDRSRDQYLQVTGNPLDDNSDSHSIALWMRPDSLPQHGSEDRMFLFESTAEGEPGDGSAWHLSLGLRASDDPSKVNLQLFTHTLFPAAKPEAAPTAHSQGGFDCLVDREALQDWTHLACTFDSAQWSLYLGGELIATHRLPVSGPASEFGGLVIGGHRMGEGRNFDGRMGEISVWSRVLTAVEIQSLVKGD